MGGEGDFEGFAAGQFAVVTWNHYAINRRPEVVEDHTMHHGARAIDFFQEVAAGASLLGDLQEHWHSKQVGEVGALMRRTQENHAIYVLVATEVHEIIPGNEAPGAVADERHFGRIIVSKASIHLVFEVLRGDAHVAKHAIGQDAVVVSEAIGAQAVLEHVPVQVPLAKDSVNQDHGVVVGQQGMGVGRELERVVPALGRILPIRPRRNLIQATHQPF